MRSFLHRLLCFFFLTSGFHLKIRNIRKYKRILSLKINHHPASNITTSSPSPTTVSYFIGAGTNLHNLVLRYFVFGERHGSLVFPAVHPNSFHPLTTLKHPPPHPSMLRGGRRAPSCSWSSNLSTRPLPLSLLPSSLNHWHPPPPHNIRPFLLERATLYHFKERTFFQARLAYLIRNSITLATLAGIYYFSDGWW